MSESAYLQDVGDRTVTPLCRRSYRVHDVRALNARMQARIAAFVADELPGAMAIEAEEVVSGIDAIKWQQRLANFHFKLLSEHRKALLALTPVEPEE